MTSYDKENNQKILYSFLHSTSYYYISLYKYDMLAIQEIPL